MSNPLEPGAALEALTHRVAVQAIQTDPVAKISEVPGIGMTLSEVRLAARQTSLLRNRQLVCRAMDISEHTLIQWLNEPAAHLSPAKGLQFLRLVAVLVRAETLFSSAVKAERWLTDPAIGLNSRIPLDLIKDSADYELLTTFMGRIEYGVYH